MHRSLRWLSRTFVQGMTSTTFTGCGLLAHYFTIYSVPVSSWTCHNLVARKQWHMWAMSTPWSGNDFALSTFDKYINWHWVWLREPQRCFHKIRCNSFDFNWLHQISTSTSCTLVSSHVQNCGTLLNPRQDKWHTDRVCMDRKLCYA